MILFQARRISILWCSPCIKNSNNCIWNRELGRLLYIRKKRHSSNSYRNFQLTLEVNDIGRAVSLAIRTNSKMSNATLNEIAGEYHVCCCDYS